MSISSRSRVFQFGDYVLDVTSYELRKQNRRVRLEHQPMEVLTLFLERRGELVTRNDIAGRLWKRDVFIEFDAGINTVIRKLRRALRDSPGNPRFIETVQGVGYRFIAEVEPLRGTVVAVLPFEALHADDGIEYVSDGLAEETISSVAQLDPSRLHVVGRTATVAYKGVSRNLAAIGKELEADFLLESSVRSANGNWRVTSTLIRVRDQARVWVDSFERATGDVLLLQKDLGRTIARQIQLHCLAPHAAVRARKQQTMSGPAYDAYLRGRYYYNQMTQATAARALECFKNAVSIDPEYALAWAGIAHTYTSGAFNGDAQAGDVYAFAREASERALACDPNLAEAHSAFATVRAVFDWNFQDAETHLRQAIGLDPTSIRSHWMLGHTLSIKGQHQSALAAARCAIDLDPLSPLTHCMMAQIAFSAREFDLAAMHAREALSAEPDYWVGHWQLGQTLLQLGRVDDAFTALAEAARLSKHNSKPVSVHAYALAVTGRAGEARTELKSLEARASQQYVPPVALALVKAGLGELDEAFAYLNQAQSVRDVHLVYLLVDAKWDSCHSDPRFAEILRSAGFTN